MVIEVVVMVVVGGDHIYDWKRWMELQSIMAGRSVFLQVIGVVVDGGRTLLCRYLSFFLVARVVIYVGHSGGCQWSRW
jgi:hypothetical protein